MKPRLGIRAQLTAGIVLTTLAAIGLLGLMSIKTAESRAVGWKAAQAENTARAVRTVLARSRLSTPQDRSTELAASLLVEAGIPAYEVRDRSGKVLMRKGALPSSAGPTLSYSSGVKVSMVGGGFFRGPGELLLVRGKIAGDGPARGGVVNFVMPLADIKEELSGVRRFLLFYAVFDSAVIIAFGLYFLSRSITRPLKRLEVAATRIAGGALGERAEVDVDNEIGSLAASFNTMAERVEEEINTLEKVNMELVSTQEKLLRSSTLAAVGRLAAGLAHEVGNPLGAVQGYLEILDRGLPDKDEEKEVLERAAREVTRIDSILRDFLHISRPSKEKAEPLDVNRVITDTVASADVHRDLKGVTVETELAEGLPPVVMDEGRLRQVFLNLLINGAQSMAGTPGPMKMRVRTSLEVVSDDDGRLLRRRRDDLPLAAGVPASATRFVVARFEDTGTGISEEDGRKIFEPFFTTKELGKGTGLGLFLSESIVQTYGGFIEFESEPGRGTAFMVRLPAAGGDET